MAIVKLTEYGFGLNGDKLQFKLQTPIDAPLTKVEICTQSIESHVNHLSQATITSDSDYNYYSWDLSKIIGDDELLHPIGINDLFIVSATFSTATLSTETIALMVSECGEDNTTCIIPIYNLLSLRLKALEFIDEIDDVCSPCIIPKNFLNKVLQVDAIEYSILCGQYDQALSMWAKFYELTNFNTGGYNCGCHSS